MIERARARPVSKPWGIEDLRPWSNRCQDGDTIGEIWFDRSDSAAAEPSLLIKLLFTSQPLSIQVHPDDTFAHSAGLPRGKTEAWYVLNAAPAAKVALGLSRRLPPQQLRAAIHDGSISDLIVWRTVSAADVIFVPAGTIHAIGAGIVIAELQQRSDITFRLFDYGRERELDVENAIAVADAGPASSQVEPRQLTAERKLLVCSPQFVFERIDLASNSDWCLEAERETWLLVLAGGAVAGSYDVATGDALFVQSDRLDIHPGAGGMVGLVAYTGGEPLPHLLQRLTESGSINARQPQRVRVTTSVAQTNAADKNGRLETIK